MIAPAYPVREAMDELPAIRILLVEDNPGDARLIRELLVDTATAFELEHVAALSAALARLAEATVDVVLLDLSLPDSRGLETLETVLERAPAVPVIVLTGMPDDDVAKRAVRAGAQDYLVKGQVDSQLLERSVGYAIERKHFEQVAEKDRRRAAQRLRESEERYRRFFEEDLTGVCTATPDGRLLDCNPAFARIFGYPSVGEIVAADAERLFPDPEIRASFLSDLRHRGKIERYEVAGRRRSGDPVYLIANVVGTFDETGELTDFRAYLFDDTDRRLAADQLRLAQRMEAVGRLAGGIAHDFNNLVTAITGYSDLLLLRLAPDAPERHELQEIKRAGERAATLTRQLLAFSRSQVLRPEVLDLNAVVAGTESMLRRLIGEDIRLVHQLDPTLGPVRADRGQIEQVLLNLVVNARDAMPQGGVLQLETSTARIDSPVAKPGVTVAPGEYALLTVTDSGDGMPREVLDRVFEPFFTTKDPGKGTGLGLSTAYGIVKQSGGYLWAYSEPGEGSTFKIYLPRVESEPPAEHHEAESPRVRRGHGRILVVEDEDAVRSLIVQILELHGYEVLAADDGRRALEVCRGCRDGIDLVISDMVMPDIRGPELEKQLAAEAPGAKLLFISGYPGQAIVQRGELPAGTPFLQKPFTQRALLDKIDEILG
jgi:PAS domain S-box-containing protein